MEATDTGETLNDPSFEDLGVRPETVASLAEKGITHPSAFNSSAFRSPSTATM